MGVTRRFDTVVVVDWSARSKPSPVKPSADAIWIAVCHAGRVRCRYHRTRTAACSYLEDVFAQECAAGRRVLAGFDFPFGFPKGLVRTVTGSDDPLQFWSWLRATIQDGADNANNRFDVARELNARFPGVGPFWGCPAGREDADLPAKGSKRFGHGLPERRHVETLVPRTQTCWKLYTTGSVGSQALLGLARLEALRARFGAQISVAPFEAVDREIVLCEVFPSLIAADIAAQQENGEIKDRAQVRVLAKALARIPPADLQRLVSRGDREEGWILGVGDEEIVSRAARLG